MAVAVTMAVAVASTTWVPKLPHSPPPPKHTHTHTLRPATTHVHAIFTVRSYSKNLMWTWEDVSSTALNDATVGSPIFRRVIAVRKKTECGMRPSLPLRGDVKALLASDLYYK